MTAKFELFFSQCYQNQGYSKLREANEHNDNLLNVYLQCGLQWNPETVNKRKVSTREPETIAVRTSKVVSSTQSNLYHV